MSFSEEMFARILIFAPKAQAADGFATTGTVSATVLGELLAKRPDIFGHALTSLSYDIERMSNADAFEWALALGLRKTWLPALER